MSVIIDTFEIVADKKNEDKGDNSGQHANTEKNFPQPLDIEAVLEHQEWRALRLRAH